MAMYPVIYAEDMAVHFAGKDPSVAFTLQGRCHPHRPPEVSYDLQVNAVRVNCGKCHMPIFHFKVATKAGEDALAVLKGHRGGMTGAKVYTDPMKPPPASLLDEGD